MHSADEKGNDTPPDYRTLIHANHRNVPSLPPLVPPLPCPLLRCFEIPLHRLHCVRPYISSAAAILPIIKHWHCTYVQWYAPHGGLAQRTSLSKLAYWDEKSLVRDTIRWRAVPTIPRRLCSTEFHLRLALRLRLQAEHDLAKLARVNKVRNFDYSLIFGHGFSY